MGWSVWGHPRHRRPQRGMGLLLSSSPEQGCLSLLTWACPHPERLPTIADTLGQRVWEVSPPPRWQGAGPPGVLCLGPGSAALSYPVLSLQTSNPIEVTGRASAVHTLLQKAPGVGGLPAHPSLPGVTQPAPHGGWWQQQARPQSRDLTLPSPSPTGVRPLPDCSQGECAAHARTCVPVSLGGRLMAGEDGGDLTDGPRGAQDSRSLRRQQEEAPVWLSVWPACHRNLGGGVRCTCRSPGRSTTISRRSR